MKQSNDKVFYHQSQIKTNQRIQAGERLRRKRMDLDLTQASFAKLLDISPSYLSSIERGMRGISSRLMYNIQDVTGMSLDYLVYGYNSPETAATGYLAENPSEYGKPALSGPVISNDPSRRKLEILLSTCTDEEAEAIYELAHNYLKHLRNSSHPRREK